MKSKLIVHLCFLVPFIITVLNVQVLVTYFVSHSLAQFMAYANMGLILLGTALLITKIGELSNTSSLWIVFFIIYFAIAILAGVLHYNDNQILLATVPFIYALGFYFYLSISENRTIFKKVTFISFILSCIICIYWDHINFDLDAQGIHIYIVDRAQGVYGDANNMALVAIISFIFIFKVYKPTKNIFIFFKLILLAMTVYSLFITFSNTGFMVFVISFIILNNKFFKGIRILFGLLLLPIIYILLLNLNNITAHVNLVGQQRDKINNIVNMVSFNLEKVDTSGRSELGHKLMNYIYENPLVGNGVNFGNTHQAHNTFLAIWADAGIFTLLFFIILLGRYFVKTLDSSPDVKFFVLPILITLCIFMLSLHSIINQPYLMALFIYMGYLIDIRPKESFET